MRYPHWNEFDIKTIFFGCNAPYCYFGAYIEDGKFSWSDMECVTDKELKNWQDWIVSQGYEIPEEYK